MVDSLEIFEKFFGPSDGYTVCLLEHQENNNDLWRLDLCYDERFKPAKFWSFLFFSGSSYAKDIVNLKTSEVRGFLKAKYPYFDAEKAIKTKVTEKLQRLIRELE